MVLKQLLNGIDYTILKGNKETVINKIEFNSNSIEDNDVFVAIQGFKVDGHNWIENAILNGASTIIVEKQIEIKEDVTVIKVNHTRMTLAQLASNYYDNPTHKIHLVGLTGTNGKTSTTYFLKAIYDYINKPIGVIGTIGNIVGEESRESKNTTPESLQVNGVIQEMINQHINHCVMEVSSHALALHRVEGCDFNIGLFTNLSEDHLELHKNMEEYFNAKAKLFEMTTDYNIINCDDVYGQKLIKKIKNSSAKLITYGLEKDADIKATNIICGEGYTHYTVMTPKGKTNITIQLPGIINVYNSLAAIACAYCSGISLQYIKAGIQSLEKIKGRFEVIHKEDDYKVIIDFAHTEDGLKKALETIRPFVKGRLILVFGVYAPEGEEGNQKRRLMSKVAAENADIAIATSDNPKELDPMFIINQMAHYLQEFGAQYKSILDRKEAIEYAINMCTKEDVVLLTGKGHESYQIIGNKEIPFDEKEIVKEIIDKIKNKKKQY
ncbi:UDP-N-acetylmuramoylalanyl-D-glutamate--2,6-diaminopimelate ligase [Natranaerovirga hydrolytica]|uniref:UDP-N-acetylmuramyl-tripeptide synthetase n=1 Tax=Natranaerovirga hydrolytica TaxID=680378 RepID=A0A4R1ML03_9FIRM|nr:UDP-N-acetylmuramoyl-L-alanyl-D-glutamate--2,6-diaminopimelate ligase [Natranaerovirga hydrolytica]TCK93175.1 UDP-N-acetylmuramoylalanyl-D-glutamate--2,6-diaminopimelate ligase [Natranaerovirga hydrolytica]